MKEVILKGRTQIVVTFAAVALMGSGLLLTAVPASADNGGPHPQFNKTRGSLHGTFHKHLSEDQRAEMHEYFQGMTPDEKREYRLRARELRTEAITQFLGITEEELRARIKNGEKIHDIVEDEGLTHEDFHEFMHQFIEENDLL